MACSQKVAGVFFSSVLFSSLIWRKMTALRFLRLKRDTVRLFDLRLEDSPKKRPAPFDFFVPPLPPFNPCF